MEEIILFDARGEIVKVYKSVLMLADTPYFKGILGETGFKKSIKQDNGSYYIDCDKKTLHNILAYIETGFKRDGPLTLHYFDKILLKFGFGSIPGNEPINDFKEDLLKNINLIIEQNKSDQFDILIEHYRFNEKNIYNIIVDKNKICVTTNYISDHIMQTIIDSEMVRNEFFKNIKKENYTYEIKIGKKIRGENIKFIFIKKHKI